MFMMLRNICGIPIHGSSFQNKHLPPNNKREKARTPCS
jgi:hypothetical protein